MKVKNVLLIFTASLLCGCGKPMANRPARWQYKTVEMESNSKDQNAYEMKQTQPNFDVVKYTDETVGSFDVTKNWDALDNEGKDGWELVSATPLIQTSYPDPDASKPFIRTEKVLLIFKRPE